MEPSANLQTRLLTPYFDYLRGDTLVVSVLSKLRS